YFVPPGFPDALRRAAKRFLNEYRSQMRPSRRNTRWRRGCSLHAPAATPVGKMSGLRTIGPKRGAERCPQFVRYTPPAITCGIGGYSMPALTNTLFASEVPRKRINARPPSDLGAGAAA